MLEDCENGIGPVDHVEVARGMPVEPLVALKTRPEQNFNGIWVLSKNRVSTSSQPGRFHGREGGGEGATTEEAFKGILKFGDTMKF